MAQTPKEETVSSLMVEVFSKLKTELLMKGYIYLICAKCNETTLHQPTNSIKYKCTQCGKLTQKDKNEDFQTPKTQNRKSIASKKGQFDKKPSN